jgi:hypothetical protein
MFMRQTREAAAAAHTLADRAGYFLDRVLDWLEADPPVPSSWQISAVYQVLRRADRPLSIHEIKMDLGDDRTWLTRRELRLILRELARESRARPATVRPLLRAHGRYRLGSADPATRSAEADSATGQKEKQD